MSVGFLQWKQQNEGLQMRFFSSFFNQIVDISISVLAFLEEMEESFDK